ncbi:MAG: orotidine-5'-phosphate decarboxylase [Flavobacteriales bacterium]|nr:orotidine-5'-phosphate decarboxylase [Flavobacteriales bacterium]
MNRKELVDQIRKKGSFLCVGLDTDPDRIPKILQKEKDPIFAFNKAIIDATADHCVAYKPNLAFYEALGPSGMESLAKTLEYIPKDFFTIADAKRGDIGNTAASYAKTFFKTYNFDSVTLAPYMGRDSIDPFLAYEGKWSIILALTSNPSADDFEKLELSNGTQLFEEVLKQSSKWGSDENIMYVVGATNADALKKIRSIVPNHFLLVPGVGAQGGSLEEVAKYGLNSDVGLLVNSSRGILYASSGDDFAEAAKKEASMLHKQMRKLIP